MPEKSVRLWHPFFQRILNNIEDRLVAAMFSFVSCGTQFLTSSTFSNSVPTVILPESRPLAMGENGTTPIPCSYSRENIIFTIPFQNIIKVLYRRNRRDLTPVSVRQQTPATVPIHESGLLLSGRPITSAIRLHRNLVGNAV